MDSYNPQAIEQKWQQRWREANLFRAGNDRDKPKCYVLEFFPYPSGDGISVGHCRNYIPCDTLARLMHMRGYNVLHPMGWDAFGLPAENEAINKGSHPKHTVPKYVENYKRQLSLLGASYDWEREVNSSQPDYYKWTQWWFLLLYKRGLAYRSNAPVNWCPHCKTVLANEEVEGGKCWRCGNWVEKRDLPQWFFKITAYAESLIQDLDEVDWPEGIKLMQRNWIGRSEGVEFDMAIQGHPDQTMRVFTTRIDTVFGVTFAVLAPEHPMVDAIVHPDQRDAVNAYRQAAQRLDEATRLNAERERSGVFTGAYVVHPVNQQPVPIYVADYVLMGYGTGAIMAVPGHDERDFDFAQKHGIEIREVISPTGTPSDQPLEAAYTEDGIMVNSGDYSGLPNREGMQRLGEWFESQGIGERKVNYRLRDWLISRQRYWGAPIPIIHCAACGEVPVPEDQLPVVLPDVDNYQPSGTGESPLAAIPEFVNTTCPQCGGVAKRETDTMGGFACSSWYFFRFCDPHNDQQAFNPEIADYWMPVDYYVGGAEHAVMHLLYARFWTKVAYDEGITKVKEPFQRLRNQGMVLALTPYRPPKEDEILRQGEEGILVRREEQSKYNPKELMWVWEKMSKSRYNVITPDEMVELYGADSLRLYESFVAPFDVAVQWDDQGMKGMHRFANRLWRFFNEFQPHFDPQWRNHLAQSSDLSRAERDLRRRTHATVKKLSEDIPDFKFNTAVAALMEWFNHLSDFGIQSEGSARAALSEAAEYYILAIAPFTPHLSDELWERYGFEGFTYSHSYPAYDPQVAAAEEVEIVIQINGKLRDRISAPAGISQAEMEQLALSSERVISSLAGVTPKKVIVVPGKLVNIVV
ncbi:MAG: leucine--tRNA ligase [Fimbriimonadia bacterium]|nr:leucine--tRNA ligase [Fimbriimonadia bacterium]